MIERLRVPNHRGVQIPAVLGLVLAVLGATSLVVVALFVGRGVSAAGWVASLGACLVAVAGLVDDLAPPGPRGLRGHLRALGQGRVTSGIVKLVVTLGCSVLVVAPVQGRTAAARIAGVLLIAGATNLWNGLDVRPARALKFFYPVGATAFATPLAAIPFAPGIVLGAMIVFPWDAGERAMLGDSGANLLGFTAGLCLFHVLHGIVLWIAAVLAVGLNVLADTVTLSRVIESTPPLRWFDRLGRSVDGG